MTSEFSIIKQLSEQLTQKHDNALIKGIGDDCAVYDCGKGKCLLISTDTFNEGIHFTRKFSTFHDAGLKAVSAGISDIYAMGGRCAFVVIAISVPKSMRASDILTFYKGAEKACRKCNTVIAGGDTTASAAGFSATVTAAGFADKKKIKYRSGARPGDTVHITGPVGYSMAGLLLLQKKMRSATGLVRQAIKQHRTPFPYTAPLDLHRITSMIDVSDGLSSELNHLARASNVRIRLDTAPLLRDPGLRTLAVRLGVSPQTLVLRSGEEYALVFTARRGYQPGRGILTIGRVESGPPEVYSIVNGFRNTVRSKGFDHFKPE
ncbi:MAG: thiamine-phosphate kinase [Fibrobacterota bacterium]